MHPILKDRWRLLAYMAAWIPIGGLLAALMSSTGGLAESLLVALPLAGLFGFLSLAAWYPCRATPLAETSILRLAGTHCLAALLTTLVWLAAGSAVTLLVERIPGFEGAADRYWSQVILLFPIGLLMFALAVAVHYLFVTFEMSREAERRALELSVLARDSELEALRSQINPHFLFNSLNSIASLAGSDPVKARAMCVALSGLLRKSLGLGGGDLIPLSEEISVAEDYLAVERVRFGERLSVVWSADDGTGLVRVPPLLLQPLIENAVIHGVAHLLEGGTISIGASREGKRVRITITNPCDPDRPESSGESLGLENVRRRLEAVFGSGAGIRASDEGDRFRVTLSFPVE